MTLSENQPDHKQKRLTSITILGWFSTLLCLMPMGASFGLDAAPNPHSTLATYCSNGICHTDPIKLPTLAGNLTSLNHRESNLIGIQLSQSCLTMIKNHINSTCLTYKDLEPLDNTNPVWAGKWVDIPYTHRLAPLVKNHFIFGNQTFKIMVDPNVDFTVNARMITIQNGNFTWINPDDSSKGGLSTITHVNRYVSNCQTAIVAPNLSLIQDTISYLESGCTTTNYNDNQTKIQTEIPFSYDNPYSTLHLQDMLKQLMHGHSSSNTNKTAGGLGPGLCLQNQCGIQDSYKKAGWDWK